MHRNLLAAAAALALFAGLPAEAAQQISWWHAMTGANAEVVTKIATDFNASQSDYEVMPVFKGTYPETLNAGIAAFRAGQAPDILQVFDVGTGVMMAAEGAVKPVAEVLEEGGFTFDKSQYLPGIVAYYSKPDGTMLSFPYNSSSPILYYNKDIFEKAGLDVDNPPKTWNEVWDAAKKIKASGAAPCGYTSTWLTWIHTRELRRLERRALRHQRERPRRQRGRAEDQRADLRQPLPGDRRPRQGRHLQVRRPHLGGEANLPRRRMRHLHRELRGLGDIVKSGMNYGIGQLPYDSDAPGAPQNTIPGGASLWVLGGKSDEIYKGVAAFFDYLGQTEVQEYLHQTSGYLPVTHGRLRGDEGSGFYDENPGRETPILQMMGKPPTANSKGVRLVNLPQVRDIQNEEFENMLAGKQTAQQALDNAVKRADEAISQALGN